MKKGRRIDIDKAKSLKEIEDFFNKIIPGEYKVIFEHLGKWFDLNRDNTFGLKWSSPEDRVRYIGLRINRQARHDEERQDICTRCEVGVHQQEPSGLGGWQENNGYTQGGIEAALDEDSGEVLKMMTKEKSWWKNE